MINLSNSPFCCPQRRLASNHGNLLIFEITKLYNYALLKFYDGPKKTICCHAQGPKLNVLSHTKNFLWKK